MALSSATLSTELQGIGFPADVTSAIAAWTAAYDTYVLESTVLGIPMVAQAAAVTAMQGAMAAGWATDAFAALQAGCIAYWGALSVPGVWGPLTIAPTVPPGGLGGTVGALTAAGVANVSGEKSLADSSDALAAAWHPTTSGGTAVVNVPPIPTPTVTPIL